jgi:hypothetical protein
MKFSWIDYNEVRELCNLKTVDKLYKEVKFPNNPKISKNEKCNLTYNEYRKIKPLSPTDANIDSFDALSYLLTKKDTEYKKRYESFLNRLTKYGQFFWKNDQDRIIKKFGKFKNKSKEELFKKIYNGKLPKLSVKPNEDIQNHYNYLILSPGSDKTKIKNILNNRNNFKNVPQKYRDAVRLNAFELTMLNYLLKHNKPIESLYYRMNFIKLTKIILDMLDEIN